MKKTWLFSSVIFYVSVLLYILFVKYYNNIGIGGAIMFSCIISSLLVAAIIYHPRYEIYFLSKRKLQHLDFFLKIIVFISFMISNFVNWPIIIIFFIIFVAINIEVYIKFTFIRHFQQITQTDIERSSDEFSKKLNSLVERKLFIFPLTFMFIFIVGIIYFLIFNYNDIAVAVSYISFSLINVYILKRPQLNQRLIALENMLLLAGIAISMILLTTYGGNQFNKDGIIELITIIIISISLTPFHLEIKKIFKG